MKQFLSYILVAAVVSLTSILAYDRFFNNSQVIIKEAPIIKQVNNDLPARQADPIRNFPSIAPTDFTTAAEAAMPAVVYIRAEEDKEFNLWSQRSVASSGSGVIISSDGFIATNNHVIEDGVNINVTLNDNREYKAEVIGTDETTDLALIKIPAEGLSYLQFGNSDEVHIGEWVLAVGNPFRLQSTVTAGIVSAKGRDINILNTQYGIESFIQTDAVVNPGNSGGALVNTNGELIGINTAIITQSGGYEGYSFAIPGNLAKKVISDLKEFGSVHRGLMGIQATSLSADRAQAMNLDIVQGVIVDRVGNNSGADEAGMRAGDVITSVNGYDISGMPQLLEILGRFRPGERVEVSYIRNNESYTVDVTLKNKFNTTDLVTVRRDPVLKNLGIEVRDLIQAERFERELDGVKVVSIYRGSTIAETQMRPGYVITSINNERVESAEGVVDLLDKLDGKIVFEGYYERYEGPFWYEFDK